jgi:hypothetical protein
MAFVGSDPANIAKYHETFPVTFRRGSQVVRLNYPTEETKLRSLRHFMSVRRAEYARLSTLDRAGACQEMTDVLGECRAVRNYIAHLDTWRSVLSGL